MDVIFDLAGKGGGKGVLREDKGRGSPTVDTVEVSRKPAVMVHLVHVSYLTSC